MSEKHNNALVDLLKEEGRLEIKRVIAAFRAVDRADFVPLTEKSRAYRDRPLPIGFDQTISAPHMVAIMTEALDVKKGQKILEIGTGSGYQAAILSKLVGKKGKIYTMETVEGLAIRAKQNLKDYDNVEVLHGDGTNGYEDAAPYDRIIVTAAGPKVPPPLVEQLEDMGILLIPVGGRYMQWLTCVRKRKDEIAEGTITGCVFVPLVGKEGWSD